MKRDLDLFCPLTRSDMEGPITQGANACVATDDHALCCAPPSSTSPRAEDGHPKSLGQRTITRLLTFMVVVFVGLVGAVGLSSQRIAARPDGKNVLVMGPAHKGLTTPSRQGTNCGIEATANAWLIVNFAAFTMPKEAHPTAPCAWMDEDRDR